PNTLILRIFRIALYLLHSRRKARRLPTSAHALSLWFSPSNRKREKPGQEFHTISVAAGRSRDEDNPFGASPGRRPFGGRSRLREANHFPLRLPLRPASRMARSGLPVASARILRFKRRQSAPSDSHTVLSAESQTVS